MDSFFGKYGKTTVFALIVVVCLSFLMHLISVSSGYLQGIDDQASDRAENYAGEQAVLMQEQFGALKMRVDYCASEVNRAGSLEFYGDTLQDNYLKKAEIEGRMQRAFENNEFHIFYQPKYNLRRRAMDGSEILIRWIDTKIDRYRTPGELLPIFEENGFINKLDRFVFYKACENASDMAHKLSPKITQEGVEDAETFRL